MKHIKLHLITFVIVVCMFMLCPFAYADSYSSIEDYISDFSSILYDNLSLYSEFSYDSNPYLISASGTGGYSNYFYAVYFSPVDDVAFNIANNSSFLSLSRVFYYHGSFSVGFSNPINSTYTFYFAIASAANFFNLYRIEMDLPLSPKNIGGLYWYSCSAYKLDSSSDLSPVFTEGLNSSVFASNANIQLWDTYYSQNSGSDCSSYFTIDDIIISQYSDDDRLKFALVDNIYGGKNLMIDIRQFINDFPIQDTSHSSVLLYPESITLIYSVDNVEKTLILDSSNSSIKSKYIFETDISNFDFDNSSQNVIITKCDFTISGNTQSGQIETQNYKISCYYYLMRFVQPIEPGSNPYSSDVDGDQTSQETKDSLEYLVTFREGYGLDFDEFTDLSFPDYYTYADVYLYNNNAAYNYILDNILSVNAVAYIIQNLANSEDDVIKQIGLFLDDSNYGEYYDVIVFDWIQETSSSYTHTYFYFETVSGRVKASTQFLQVMQDDLNKVKINTAAAFTAIDNLENESIQFFNAKLGFDENILGWVKTIDNSINNLDFPTYDDSNLLSVLGQIKDLLSSPANEIDTPQECIQLYEAHPNYFDELWGTSNSLRSASRASNPFSGSEYVRADLVPAWWEGKTLTMIYLIKNDGSTSRFYNDMLNGLYTAYDNLISSNNAFNDYINSLFKYNFDYSGSFYGHLFSLDYNPEEWSGGFNE